MSKQPLDRRLKVIPPALKAVPAPVSLPVPAPEIQIGIRTYQDAPGFGFLIVTVNKQPTIIACNFTPQGQIVIPLQQMQIITSEQQADAFKDAVKADTLKPKLIVPGGPGWRG